MLVLKGTPTDLNVVVRDIDQFNKRGTIKGASQSALLKILQDADESRRLTKHDLRKAHYALKSLDGSNGPEAKSAAETFVAMADGQIFTKNRMALTIADFADEGPEGKATLADLADIARKVNAENKTPETRAQALCKHFSDVARGNPEREASFRKLQRCPNYQIVFTACSL